MKHKHENKLKNNSKGVSSLKSGSTLADVAMVAAVPLNRVRYQVKVLSANGKWGNDGANLWIIPPAAGRPATLTKAASLALYNLVTVGTVAG